MNLILSAEAVGGGSASMLVMLVLMFAVFYFFFILYTESFQCIHFFILFLFKPLIYLRYNMSQFFLFQKLISVKSKLNNVWHPTDDP